jgi:hypothetical protein
MSNSFETLRLLAEDDAPEFLRDLCGGAGAADEFVDGDPHGRRATLVQRFAQLSLLVTPTLELAPRGRICNCAIGLIEGADVVSTIDRLRELEPAANRITIVREGMTTAFLRLLGKLSGLHRVMICSPWINLDRKRLNELISAVERSRRATGFQAEVSVVTRPVSDQPDGAANQTLNYLRSIDAPIFFKQNLHSKLYVVESSGSPPQRYAFVGSENFTKVRYQELGLRIANDYQLVDDVVRYFLSIADA